MSAWYLQQAEDGAHLGPMSTEMLVQGIRARTIPGDAWVACDDPEGVAPTLWRRADTIPEIAEALAAVDPQDLRVIAGGFTSNLQGQPEFGSSVMIAPRRTK